MLMFVKIGKNVVFHDTPLSCGVRMAVHVDIKAF